MAGRVVSTGRSERVSDMAHSLRFALGDIGVEASAGMFVPLQFRGLTLGVIEAFDRLGGPEFVWRTSDCCARPPQARRPPWPRRSRSSRSDFGGRLRAAEEERRRWARELHDETLQGLGGLRVLLPRRAAASNPDSLHSAVESAVDQLGEEIANLRALITELRPAALDELGLAARARGAVRPGARASRVSRSGPRRPRLGERPLGHAPRCRHRDRRLPRDSGGDHERIQTW